MTIETPSLREARTMLGVGAGASRAQVVSAFRHRARTQHPDVSHTHDAAARFAALVTAYQVVLRAGRDESESGPERAAGGPTSLPTHPTSRTPGHLVAGPQGTTFWEGGRPVLLIGPVVTHRSATRGSGRQGT